MPIDQVELVREKQLTDMAQRVATEVAKSAKILAGEGSPPPTAEHCRVAFDIYELCERLLFGSPPSPLEQ